MTDSSDYIGELEGGNGLGFHIEKRGETHVVVSHECGVRPATPQEIALWNALQGWAPPEEVEELRKDKRRLDWLASQREDMVQQGPDGEPELYAHGWGIYEQCNTLRHALDIALFQSGGD